MNNDGFIQLRKTILDQAVSLLDSAENIAIEDKYALSVQIAQSRGTLEAYEKAFQVAQQLDVDDKISVYLDLLSEVDTQIQLNSEEFAIAEQDTAEEHMHDQS